ncbi:MAG: helix-turn-helix transcriptional regulator [Bacteroidales bacterium]|nr:helix-turn-helix transcriptional regulator [Bacteroidales bacterium]MDT8432095.1 helix-turn-helix transcriptional regulator [Bacteroidales bacterium]
MSLHKEKIKQIASKEASNWQTDATKRQLNKEWTDKSFKIAVRILREIRAQKNVNGMTQKKLADEMNVSPQYINKVLKGKENLTLETISKIEKVLDIRIIEVSSHLHSITLDKGYNKLKPQISRATSVPLYQEVISYKELDFLKPTGTNG